MSSGKVAGDSLERVTTAIVKISDATGIATEKLVSDFNDIAADPVAAITKLNDQYHFLTLATYNQIKRYRMKVISRMLHGWLLMLTPMPCSSARMNSSESWSS